MIEYSLVLFRFDLVSFEFLNSSGTMKLTFLKLFEYQKLLCGSRPDVKYHV